MSTPWVVPQRVIFATPPFRMPVWQRVLVAQIIDEFHVP